VKKTKFPLDKEERFFLAGSSPSVRERRRNDNLFLAADIDVSARGIFFFPFLMCTKDWIVGYNFSFSRLLFPKEGY